MNINDVVQKRIDDSNEKINWLPIKNIDGYLINQFGQIKSLKRKVTKRNGKGQTVKERILKVYQNDNCRCLQVSLCIDGKVKQFCIRRLVAEAFLDVGRNDKSIIVVHKNDDFTNCYFDNLKIYDADEYRIKILNDYDVSSRRKVIAIKDDDERLEFDSVLEASQHFGKAYKTLQCKIGTQSQVNGYIFEYGDLI